MAFPSTYIDIQNAVRAKLRTDAVQDVQKIRDWINQCYAQVAVETEPFQASALLSLTPQVDSYTMPTTLIRLKIIAVQPTGQSGFGPPWQQSTLEQLTLMRQSTGGSVVSPGEVRYYCIQGLNRLEVFPTPAYADTVLIFYTYLPIPLVSDEDIPNLPEPFASKLLEYGTLAEAADFLAEPRENNYRQLYEIWTNKFRQHLRRKQGGMTRQLAVSGGITYTPHDPSTDLG